MPGRAVDVLYIAGTGRSGSTVLAAALGAADGFFFAGEVRYLWQRGLVEARLCGCGRPLPECPFWRGVLKRAYGDADLDAAPIAAAQRRATRTRRVPALLAGAPAADAEHVDRLGRLYRAIADESGARVVVDSSKLPAYGVLLRSVPDIDLRVVHLVRDPRAVAYSWQRRKEQPDRRVPGYMQQRPAVKTALMWTLVNATTSRLLGAPSDRFSVVRYEDFAARPREVLQDVLAHAGADAVGNPVSEDRTVELGPNHSVAGNPDRLDAGTVAIRTDEGATKLTGIGNVATTAGALPLLRRYRYPVRRPRRHG